MNYNGNFVAKNLYQVTNNVLERVLDAGVKVNGGLRLDGTNIESTFNSATNTITLGDSGVATGVYSAVSVNNKGLVTAGGNILEFGAEVGDNPTAALAIGGLFFRRIA
jgi:phage-related tail fiber protein